MTMIENNPNLLSSTIFGANGILGNEYGSIPYSNNEKALTLKQLLEHTAGGTAWGPQNDPMFLHMYLTNKQFIGWILDTRDPDLLPGSYYAYSNFGYHLLGRVIEKLSGISYESYVQENVLKQCGITDMHIGGNLWTDRRYFMIIGSSQLTETSFNLVFSFFSFTNKAFTVFFTVLDNHIGIGPVVVFKL